MKRADFRGELTSNGQISVPPEKIRTRHFGIFVSFKLAGSSGADLSILRLVLCWTSLYKGIEARDDGEQSRK